MSEDSATPAGAPESDRDVNEERDRARDERRHARSEVRRVEAWLLARGVPFVVRFAGGRRTLSRMVPGLVFLAVLGAAELIARPIVGRTEDDIMVALVEGPVSDLRASVAFLVLLAGGVLGGIAAHLTAQYRRSSDRLSSAQAVVGILVVLLVLAFAHLAISGSWHAFLSELSGLLGAALLLYLLIRSGLGALIMWGMKRLIPEVRDVLRLLTRALPLQLVLVAFLVVSTEAWQVADALNGFQLAAVVLFFSVAALLFIAARFPGELFQAPPDLAPANVAAVCSGTPLERYAEPLDPSTIVHHPLRKRESTNLVLTAVVSLGVQVVFLSLLMFVALVVFGGIAIRTSVIETWVEHEPRHVAFLAGLPITVQLLKVAVVIASFAGLQFATQAITDADFRQDFFDDLVADLSQTLVAREVYLAGLEPYERAMTKPGEEYVARVI